MSEEMPVVINNSFAAQQTLSCDTDSVTICGRDPDNNSQTVRTDSTGRLDVTAAELDIRNLTCDRDNVRICGSSDGSNSTVVRTDAEGNLFVNINRQFLGDYQSLVVRSRETLFSTVQDISQVSSYAFYIRHNGDRQTTIPLDVSLELAPDDDDTHFFPVQFQAVPPGTTRFFPFIESNNFSTGFPLPGKRARLRLSNAVGARDIPVDVGFAAWK